MPKFVHAFLSAVLLAFTLGFSQSAWAQVQTVNLSFNKDEKITIPAGMNAEVKFEFPGVPVDGESIMVLIMGGAVTGGGFSATDAVINNLSIGGTLNGQTRKIIANLGPSTSFKDATTLFFEVFGINASGPTMVTVRYMGNPSGGTGSTSGGPSATSTEQNDTNTFVQNEGTAGTNDVNGKYNIDNFAGPTSGGGNYNDSEPFEGEEFEILAGSGDDIDIDEDEILDGSSHDDLSNDPTGTSNIGNANNGTPSTSYVDGVEETEESNVSSTNEVSDGASTQTTQGSQSISQSSQNDQASGNDNSESTEWIKESLDFYKGLLVNTANESAKKAGEHAKAADKLANYSPWVNDFADFAADDATAAGEAADRAEKALEDYKTALENGDHEASMAALEEMKEASEEALIRANSAEKHHQDANEFSQSPDDYDYYLPNRIPSASEQAINAHLFTAEEDRSNPIAERIRRTFNRRERDANGVKGLTTWVNVSFNGGDGGDLATGRNSSSFNLSTGAQYQVNETVAVGAALRFANNDSETVGTGTEIDSTIYGIALFSNILLPEDIRLQITGAYEMASNDVVSNGNTGSFDYDSLIFSAGISKSFALDKSWTFTPHARYSTSRTDQEGYTNSAGTFIAGQEFDVSILSYGGTLAGPVYDSRTSDRYSDGGIESINANIGLAGTTFLERADGTDNPSDTSNLQNESGGATLSGGLNFKMVNAITSSLGGSITFADGENPWSVYGSVNMPIDGDFTDAALKPSSFSLNGNYSDLPDGRYTWSFGGSVELQLQSFVENAPEDSALSFAADLVNGGHTQANARLLIPLQ